MKKLTIKVDTNDGDYVTRETLLNHTEEQFVEHFVDKLVNFRPYSVMRNNVVFTHTHNFPIGDAHRPDLGEKSVFDLYSVLIMSYIIELIPRPEHGFHTIVSMKWVDDESGVETTLFDLDNPISKFYLDFSSDERAKRLAEWEVQSKNVNVWFDHVIDCT